MTSTDGDLVIVAVALVAVALMLLLLVLKRLRGARPSKARSLLFMPLVAEGSPEAAGGDEEQGEEEQGPTAEEGRRLLVSGTVAPAFLRTAWGMGRGGVSGAVAGAIDTSAGTDGRAPPPPGLREKMPKLRAEIGMMGDEDTTALAASLGASDDGASGGGGGGANGGGGGGGGDDDDDDDGQEDHSGVGPWPWADLPPLPPCAGQSFRVRCGPDYRRKGRKMPSADAFYDVIGASQLCAGAPLAREGWRGEVHPRSGAPLSAAHVAQPGPGGALRMPRGDAAAALAARWPGTPQGGGELLPPLFIVNFKMPLTAPALRASSATDAGTNWVFVCRLRESTRAALAREPRERWPAALRLLVDWVRDAPSDPAVSGRFKLIAQVVDIRSLGLGSFVEGYNGKPVLITKSGTIHSGPGYMEMEADVHRFNVLARKTLRSLHAKLPGVRAQVGLVIQGTADDELPEQMLACAEVPDCNVLPPGFNNAAAGSKR